jgi:hypothetical protein
MLRRVAPVALIILALAPASAAAQTPDESANARALAAIGVRTTTHIVAIRGEAQTSPPRCQATRRLQRRGTARQIEQAETLFAAHWIARYSRAAAPVIAAAAAGMQAVPTADPVLRSGRVAWRRVAGAYVRFGAFAHVHYCSEIRDYVRNDFRPTPTMRAAARMYDRAMNWDTTDIDQRQAAAVARLVELGVPPVDADAFDGTIEA